MEIIIEIVRLIVGFIGCILVWYAVDYKRPKEYQIDIHSKDGYIQAVIVIVGMLLFTIAFSN